MSGYKTPSIVENIKVPKKILFIDINDSFDKDAIFLLEISRLNLYEKSNKEVITSIPINERRYSPLSGSFANEWTLSIIPDLTMKAPNKLKEKTIIESNNVHILKIADFEDALKEWINAVAASHGIKATFSTGSQNQ